MHRVEITELHIYPVKSLQGIALASAKLTRQGLEHDRRFMLVSSSNRFVTQREIPRMATIQTHMTDAGVVLSAAGRGSIGVPFEEVPGEPILTKVWGDDCETVDMGKEISNWLSAALESSEPLKLVRMASGYLRPQKHPERLGKDTNTLFADAAPLLVANESSLAELNHALETRGLSKAPMNRFRPNVVVRGLQPFSEHRISELRADKFSIELSYPCERCVITTIDQSTGKKDPDQQPFKTIREINPMPGKKTAPAFAQNAIVGHGAGQWISVGDSLAVVASSHQNSSDSGQG